MGYEICYNNASAEKELGTKPGLNASSTKQTVSYNVSPSKEAELTLQFNLGNAAGANSFTISNIKIEDAKEVSSKNLIPNFRYNAVGYLNGMADEGYVTSFRRDDSSATFKIKKAPDERNPWNASNMPAVNSPFMMRSVPTMSTATFASCTRRPGTAPK